MDPIATLRHTNNGTDYIKLIRVFFVLTSGLSPDSIVPQTEPHALFFSLVSPVLREEE